MRGSNKMSEHLFYDHHSNKRSLPNMALCLMFLNLCNLRNLRIKINELR
jgi:hypothetical protein